MPSAFDFATANTKRLITLPFYLVASAVALVSPRSRRLWVFGRQVGIGEAPLTLLLEARRRPTPLRLVWLASRTDDLEVARSLGIEAYPKNSARATWLTMRAGVTVVAYGLGDVVRYCAPGSFIVYTGHGPAVKHIHLDAPGGARVKAGLLTSAGQVVFRTAFWSAGRLIKMVPAASQTVAAHFTSAWRWKDGNRVVVTGDPRCDVLLGDPEDNRRTARATLGRALGETGLPSRLVIWAPTWRDEQPTPRGPWHGEQERLRRLLQALDAWFVVRAHPFKDDLEDSLDVPPRVKFLSPSRLTDLNTTLSAFDVLITDYSGVAVDYALLNRPQIFYAPDLLEYQRSRGLYEPYATFTGGLWHESWSSVLTELERVLSDAAAHSENVDRTSASIRSLYFDDLQGPAAPRVVDAIMQSVLGGGVRA